MKVKIIFIVISVITLIIGVTNGFGYFEVHETLLAFKISTGALLLAFFFHFISSEVARRRLRFNLDYWLAGSMSVTAGFALFTLSGVFENDQSVFFLGYIHKSSYYKNMFWRRNKFRIRLEASNYNSSSDKSNLDICRNPFFVNGYKDGGVKST